MLQTFAALTGWNASLALLLVKTTIILVAALGITLTMRRASATARHLVWLVTLGTLLLVPLLAAWAPLKVAVLPVRPDMQLSRRASLAPNDATSEFVIPSTGQQSAASAVLRAPRAASPGAMSRAIDTISAMSPLALIALVWSIVLLGIMTALAWAGLAVRRIVRTARVLDSDAWVTPLLEIADRLGIDELPRLVQSSESKMPFACGLLKATIVLPEDSDSWSLERRRAVLLHELAHVRRHDLLGHTLGRIACAVYWFHPLVWKAAKQLRNESERACDDLALSCGTRATDYAEHLLDIVTTVRGDTTPLVALAMARRKEFEGRMLAILDPDLRRAAPTRRQSAALIAALALISLTVAATAPVARSASAATVARQVITNAAPAPKAAPVAPVVPNQPQGKAYPDSGIRGVMHTRTAEATAVSQTTSVSTSTNITPSVTVDAQMNESLRVIATEATRFGLNVSAEVLTALGKGEKGGKGDKGVKSDERVTLLVKILRADSSASMRRVAAWGLREHTRSAEAVDALSEALRKDANETVREMAAWALGEGDSHAASTTAALNTALKNDASDKVRATSAWAIGQMGDHGNVDGLVSALGDASANVRIRAAWAIGEVSPRTAPKPLVGLLADKDAKVRMLAAWALHNIADPSTAPAIQAALKSEQSRDVQQAMTKALLSLGEASVEAIKGLLESPDPAVKQMAVRALAGRNATGPWPWPWPEPRPFP